MEANSTGGQGSRRAVEPGGGGGGGGGGGLCVYCPTVLYLFCASFVISHSAVKPAH